MISVVLYGRNDNYGYNLHKRAALSFNCIAEVLGDSDEILFVDYNTPDDYPTFPEAIRDTLTNRARKMLRVLRARPTLHEKFRHLTRLVALEPIARNIAVRRSNPSNRWILSTNTDLIFTPLSNRNLTEICSDLPNGFYHTPRIELPETLWENLDRHQPRLIIDTIRDWGKSLHLNEIVYGSDVILYDGPGDFQLMLRDDLFKYHGFDERMLLGWHVDSNIARRLKLIYGKVGDLGKEVYGYHCDHTRQVTTMHSHNRTENDWRRFIENVSQPEVQDQAETWGCPDDNIEEIHLDSPSVPIYVQALRDAVGEPLVEPTFAEYTSRTYNKVDYDPRHVLSFLTDNFVTAPRTLKLAWYGGSHEMLRRFITVWHSLGFQEDILVDREYLAHWLMEETSLRQLSRSDLLTVAQAFVFDFALPKAEDNKQGDEATLQSGVFRALLSVVRTEQARIRAKQQPRRIIALNAINNDLEGAIKSLIGVSHSPFSCRIRQGYALPAVEDRQDWLAAVSLGPGVQRSGSSVVNENGHAGILVFGPRRHLEPGTYRLAIRLDIPQSNRGRAGTAPCVLLEVISGPHVLALRTFRYEDLVDGANIEVVFEVPLQLSEDLIAVETRFRILDDIRVSLRELSVESFEPAAAQDLPLFDALNVENWLPFLYTGSAVSRHNSNVILKSGVQGFAVYGPYWPLPKGKYFLTITIEGDSSSDHVGLVDVVIGDREIASKKFYVESGTFGLPFEIVEDSPQVVETRVYSSGATASRLCSMSVARVRPLGWLPYLHVGPAGRWNVDGADSSKHVTIRVPAGEGGFALYGPYWKLDPGSYEMLVEIAPDATAATEDILGSVDVFSEGRVVVEHPLRVSDSGRSASGLISIRVPFDVSSTEKDALFETRIVSAGRSGFHVHELMVCPR